MKALAIATVSRSLALQSPQQWTILRDLGFEITFAAGEDDYSEVLAGMGTFVPIDLQRSLGLGSSRSTVRQLKALVGSEAWQLVQLQSPIAAAYSRMAIPRRRKYPVLYIVHGFHFHPDGRRHTNAAAFAAERLFTSRTDHVAVVAKWDRGAAGRLGYDPDQITLLPGAGVDLQAFGHPSTRRGTGALLFVGDLNANKDPLRAIRLMVPLRERRPTATLLLVGDGPLYDTCHELVAQLGLLDAVQIVRRSEEVPRLMAEADCLISCSRREGLPRVIIEALASGMGVVAMANRGTRELLEDWLTTHSAGRLIEQGADDHTWVDALDIELEEATDTRANERRAHATRWDIESFSRVYREMITTLAPAAGGPMP